MQHEQSGQCAHPGPIHSWQSSQNLRLPWPSGTLVLTNPGFEQPTASKLDNVQMQNPIAI